MQNTVLITGVSSGIGEATAAALAQAGYRVFGGARTPFAVAPIAGVELLELDVRQDEQVRRAVDLVLEQAGRIDIVINNAGVSLIGPVEASSDAEAQALFDTNLFGVLRVMRAVLPAMRQQQSGLILNISSVLGFLPAPFMGLYASSKHALEGLSESLDHEVRGFGVRVMLVQPNFTNTRLDANAPQTRASIPAYGEALSQTLEALQKQVAAGEAPSRVASKIISAIRGGYRMRHPANPSARLLSFLRRFAPAGAVDKGIRSTFGLKS
ncbi:NAD(P)-dependent dehydrogenase (short-subunit alcohol dehydrogenase family) [Novosphingobium sp. SG751A]|uniref:oxidoreductase n=1 Tax=Novosphingobium sp. SG751A TaxID=2587000 RepID=UPI001551E05B|nr:oxidoreductase [Novosphingobium sp. SG751A]NOW48663.1 NAD(P)-dependent dehydrogenase (short-subunit alcohol dehydrogenase family) [Novosphingobium sp. SG751A]